MSIPSLRWVAIVATMSLTVADSMAQEKPPTLKRINRRTAEELRKQLENRPEIGLDQTTATNLYAIVLGVTGNSPESIVENDAGPKLYANHVARLQRPDLLAVPWRAGADCRLSASASQTLGGLSADLRLAMRSSARLNNDRTDAEFLRATLLKGAERWKRPEALPTLVQMLQAEDEPVRTLLVDALVKIPGREASVALAQRALFDLAPDVRASAIDALRPRPVAEYRATLVDGLRWPWPPVVEHAAEALVALKVVDAAAEIDAIRAEPDPTAPHVKDNLPQVRELVKVNHMSNCMLCHAPSLLRTDGVRGRVPIPGESPPPLYYQEPSGMFVRADITYLRQDFSVVQPVANPGKWPAQQRYDYFLRTRLAYAQELAPAPKVGLESCPADPRQLAFDFALNELRPEGRVAAAPKKASKGKVR